MHVIISPAKKQDFSSWREDVNSTETLYPDMAYGLITHLKQLTPGMISKTMKISPALGELNYHRFQNYQKILILHWKKACYFCLCRRYISRFGC